MSILDNIDSPEDVKALSTGSLDELCSEIREFLISSVSKTGGHLASNLGVVELTVAVHRVFDTSKDRLVFDVGHQCYVHKMLTGRKAQFETLRQLGGLEGFPKPSESPHDAFIAGHASNSISVALGIARARTLSRGEYSVLALLGDGALTGGFAFEGLSDAGESGEPMIVILNDNGMSITDTVGGIARLLSRQRMKPSYAKFKKRFRRFMEIMPGGRAVYRFTHGIKTAIKHTVLKCSLFEELGLQYTGPIDGHNIKLVVEALEWAKRQSVPAVVHVITQKGKGYKFSEQDPQKYHGVGPFNLFNGVAQRAGPTFSAVFGEELRNLAGQDPRICAITASMAAGTGLNPVAAAYPERFFDVGIAEGHAVAMAAGMASRGAIPVVAVYSTFLQRSYDMLIHDVSISNLHIVFAVDRAGIVSGDGGTHQGVFDVAYLSSVPGMKIFCPASFAELRDMLLFAIETAEGPVAVRYPRGGEGGYTGGGSEFVKRVREGGDYTFVTHGININTVIDAADILAKEGVSAEIIKLGCINPIEMDLIEASVRKTKRLLVLEECIASGSAGERIAAALAGGGSSLPPVDITLLNLGESVAPCGEIDELRRLCGIDAASVCAVVREKLHEKKPA